MSDRFTRTLRSRLSLAVEIEQLTNDLAALEEKARAFDRELAEIIGSQDDPANVGEKYLVYSHYYSGVRTDRIVLMRLMTANRYGDTISVRLIPSEDAISFALRVDDAIAITSIAKAEEDRPKAVMASTTIHREPTDE